MKACSGTLACSDNSKIILDGVAIWLVNILYAVDV
jgi:hypothetical protein